MGLFSRTPKKELVILIDIAADSVAGGYAVVSAGSVPVIHYSVRLPLTETPSATVRGLEAGLAGVIRSLVEQGAQAVHRAEGAARPDRIMVSVSSPWQKATARMEHVARSDNREFVFTKKVMDDSVARSSTGSKEHVLTEEIVAGVLLNGYETTEPFGTRAKYADLAIMSSEIAEETALKVHTMLREAFHTRAIQILSATPVCYTVLRDVFPHEHDFLAATVSDDFVDITLIKQGMPHEVLAVPAKMRGLLQNTRAMADMASSAVLDSRRADVEASWITEVQTGLSHMRSRHPLPRTIFLSTAETRREIAKNLFDAPSLRALWLSDRPLTIIPLVSGHFSSYVSVRENAVADLPLAMLALYSNKSLQ